MPGEYPGYIWKYIDLVKRWSDMLREKPENLGARTTKQIDQVKRVIAPFYMDHIESFVWDQF